jgi:DNA-binding transcriptional LysR family regulator
MGHLAVAAFPFAHFGDVADTTGKPAQCQALFSYFVIFVFCRASFRTPTYCRGMDIRQLQYLAALAREKHFTRAAQACNITQPTLSGRIRQMEQELGVPLLERGQRFIGLTPEGERVLKWAHTILDNWQSLQSELQQIKGKKGQLVGRMVLGVIPSALPKVSSLTRVMNAAHPAVDFTVLSQSSEEIIRALNDFSIEAGITYLDNEPVEGLMQAELYRENYCLFVEAGHELAGRASVTWFEAAQQPLCLLTPNMQNRRIIDRAFAAAKVQPTPRLETNSIMNLLASVRNMGLCSIMPDYFRNALGTMPDVVAVPLAEPTVSHSVGLVAVDREPQSPLVAALFASAKAIGIPE